MLILLTTSIYTEIYTNAYPDSLTYIDIYGYTNTYTCTDTYTNTIHILRHRYCYTDTDAFTFYNT